MPRLLSCCRHPGGEQLTRRLAALAVFKRGDHILDIGCGDGDSLLLLKNELGAEITGLETDEMLCGKPFVTHFDGKRIPADDGSFDGIIMECSLSCADEAGELLSECRRVLKPDGTLAISDMYAGRTPGVIRDLRGYNELFTGAGFEVYYEEDASGEIDRLFGQLLFSGGEEAVEEAVGFSRCERKSLRPGYRIWILIPDMREELVRKYREEPLISADAIAADPMSYLKADPKDIARIITLGTSGSSGKKKRIFFTDEDMMATADFFTAGMAPMVSTGGLVTVFMRGSGLYSIAGLLGAACERLGARVENYGDLTDLDDAARAAAYSECIVGIPGDMAALVAVHPELRPKSVLLSADYASDAVCRRIKETWHCKLFKHWGMTETGYGGAVTMEDDELYRIRRDLLVTIADPETGDDLPEDTEGEVVITTPERVGMPLFRYRTGDIARLIKAPGGGMRLTGFAGRRGDEVSVNGSPLSIHILDELLYNIRELIFYEAEYDTSGKLRIGFLGDVSRERIESVISGAFPGICTELYAAAFRPGKRTMRIV